MPRNTRSILLAITTVGLIDIATPRTAEAETSSTTPATCAPLKDIPAVRTVKMAGSVANQDGLSVHSPPWAAPLAPGLRLRTHAQRDGNWSVWNGSEVPSFVPIESGGGRWLDLLDLNGTTYVAVYRARVVDWRTQNNKNLSSEVRLFDCSGKELVSVVLDSYLSRPQHLEVQDVRYDGTTLYFNEACQSFSRDAGGKCSSLIALDPNSKVLWRTGPLVSNNWFALTGDYIVAAYGFTGEPAAIRVIRKKDGAIMQTQKLQGTNFELFQQGDSIAVEHWNNIGRTLYKMVGFDGVAPKLVRGASINPSPADPAGKPSPPRAPRDPGRPVPTGIF